VDVGVVEVVEVGGRDSAMMCLLSLVALSLRGVGVMMGGEIRFILGLRDLGRGRGR
jgi:hypothetical protein